MTEPLRVLFVEDSENDMTLEVAALQSAGFQVVWERVQDDPSLRLALKGREWDVILSDHRMPELDSTRALAVRNEIAPDTPFLLVSGGIGEDAAVEAMKAGAQDYVLKHDLRRLAPAVRREVREAGERKARRKAEAQLLQSQKLELVGQLAGGVAHDFNNLLTVIGGYCELLLAQTPAGSPQRPAIVEIRKASERAAALTRQLLAFSRREAIQPAVLDLNAAVAEAHPMLQRLIGSAVELTTVPAPELHRVKADRGQIDQVLMNLAVNARDAMGGRGRLTIRTRNVSIADDAATADLPPGDYVALDVADTGCGMSGEVLARIFEPFFTTKEPGRGTGLGLATVRGIVKQTGGAITVASAVGAGTTFTVQLPRVDGAVAVPATATSSVTSIHTGTETILIVDDSAAIRRLAAGTLSALGYRVLEAGEGMAALRACREHSGPVHLVLTDVVMPLMSGTELASTLAAVRPEAVVLYMSGYVESGEIPGPPGRFLQKPFTPEALALKVRTVLDGGP